MNVKKRIRRQVRTLDGLSAALVLAAICYCWSVLPALPDAFWVDPGIFHEEAVKLEKAAVWRDVALLTGLYATFTLIELAIDRLKIDRPIRRIKPQMVTAWFKFGLLMCVATIIVSNLSAVQQP
ncbi:hypothetical protein SAMN05216327_102185 [Dyadobacter sp. SG02]|uniref:hypothetical protein n=1 Tax=Dyadobacter sp. SG02 TaxID=1855291 RepID=UPI0008C1B4E3|nr:hypothetical protein [Dyadobacter sp. SG02]SEI51963.1 hypothetical protein SAMN05216327_102185 [Dyadobacter sp. SG02]